MPARLTFPRSHRLSGDLQFARVFDAKIRTSRGPLTVYATANGLDHSRLGLSVSRRVGIATRRTRLKRLIREAYRLHRHAWPVGYDWVVVVRPHQQLRAGEYADHLASAVRKLDAVLRAEVHTRPIDAPPVESPQRGPDATAP